MSRPPELNLELIRLQAEQDGLASPAGAVRSNSPPPPADEIIVRADEVDRIEEDKPQRPILRREGSAPPPPPLRQPPVPAPLGQDDGQRGSNEDSLSLSQLRDIVSHLPKLEPKAYAYAYSETRTLAEEIEEWFQYTEEDKNFLLLAKEHFGDAITEFNAARGQKGTTNSWYDLSTAARNDFVSLLLQIAHTDDIEAGEHALLALSYLAIGAWTKLDDAPENPSEDEKQEFEPPNDKYRRFIPQLRSIQKISLLLCENGAVPFMFSHLQDLFSRAAQIPWASSESSDINKQCLPLALQMTACLTTLYFIALSGLQGKEKNEREIIRNEFIKLKLNPLQFLTQVLARLRWDEAPYIPFTRVLLLLWKLVLLVIGNANDRERVKQNLRHPEEHDKDKNETFLTASPLDYHAFRQEITSKYPAYNPPPPLVPLEINNNSMLPLTTPILSSHASREDLSSSQGASKSIFHASTHIATPAPSPPPTPGPPGKGGKKQNYQTNQNFPFLYPPLDGSSNDLGGKGGAQLQDQMVGKKWEGSDIPASILEAAQLFHSRMRMSRALRQLWDVREQFMKYDRGWAEEETKLPEDDYVFAELDSDDEPTEDQEKRQDHAQQEPSRPETNNPEVQIRLDEIEKYYRGSFKDLQSIVIVLLKVLLSNITVLGSPSGGLNGDTQANDKHLELLPKENLNLSLCLIGAASNEIYPRSDSIEGLNSIRVREITSKAISGLLLSLLKWFRVSHILKFEYFAQLLLDSNYVPLSLKYFALQDIDKAVDLKHDRDDLSFFRFCHHLSLESPASPISSSPPQPRTPDSVDEAIPPPIARARPPSPSSSSSPPSPGLPPTPPRKPEVDELGYPTTTIPSSPLTTYAPRFFHIYITLLRVLQKLTKSHAHRSLLLIQYKSSTILRKGLKIPQPELRLYTLKLFKSQVPYCGRKWRQNNMRVITAIYVFCRMGLRDEWISGNQGMVDEWVEGARDVERAWRGLCGWWHKRVYKDVLAEAGDIASQDEAEMDFFARELEKMGWSIGGLIEDMVGYEEVNEGMDITEVDGLPPDAASSAGSAMSNHANEPEPESTAAESALLRQLQTDI